MIEIISLIVSVASSLFGIAVSLQDTKKDRAQQAGNLLTEISEILYEVVEKLKNNEVPHGACETLRTLALQLPDALEDIVENPQQYGDMLLQAHNVEMLYMETQKDKSQLEYLEKAAGKFKTAGLLFLLES